MCRNCEAITGIVVIVFALWQTLYSKWILVLAGVFLLINPWVCKKFECGTAPMEKPKPKRKR